MLEPRLSVTVSIISFNFYNRFVYTYYNYRDSALEENEIGEELGNKIDQIILLYCVYIKIYENKSHQSIPLHAPIKVWEKNK